MIVLTGYIAFTLAGEYYDANKSIPVTVIHCSEAQMTTRVLGAGRTLLKPIMSHRKCMCLWIAWDTSGGALFRSVYSIALHLLIS